MAERLPPPLAPHDAGNDVPGVLSVLRGMVESHITNQPRSLQKRIGPSQIGSPCDHCVAAKLAGWEQPPDPAWLPFIGTAIHEQLEKIVTDRGKRQPDGKPYRFLCERRVTVGQIAGVDISGSTDLFDTATGTVFDYKVVGESKLRSVKTNGPGQTYRAQAHLYGRGWVAAGHPVNQVCIVFLPRNAPTGWNAGMYWSEPYDEQVALAALARAGKFANTITLLESLDPTNRKRDDYITNLPRDPQCFDCARYGDAPSTLLPGRKDHNLLLD